MYMLCTIGIDEVGRGPLAGPVTVCVFASQYPHLLDLFPHQKLKDSKQLNHQSRAEIYTHLKQLQQDGVVDFEVMHRSAHEIDTKGISVCIREMISEGLDKLAERNADISIHTHIFLDGGLKAPQVFNHTETIIKGDASIVEIACASIIAKEVRDELMRDYAKRYPEYGFETHMGYATKRHREAIQKHGKTEIHRNSFIHFA